MGRQVNFFLHPDDQESFDILLKSFEDITFIPYYHYSNNIVEIPDTILRDYYKEGDRIYLIRMRDINKLELRYIDTQGYWLIDNDKGFVIEFDRCLFKDNKIYRGRLYFRPQYVENNNWVNKPEDFVKWSDKILLTARRKLNKYQVKIGDYHTKEYFGDNAIKWSEKHKAVLIKGGLELYSTA